MSLRHADQSTRKTPCFCPGCRKAVGDSDPSGLCAHCGDRLHAQGYCSVCEDYWPLAVGSPCPKHEIELEPSEPEAAERPSVDPRAKWVEVARFSDTLACQPPRIRLEAEGIPTIIDGERMGGKSMYHVATGGVALRVPETLAAEARVILSQTWSATAAALNIDDWDDIGADELEPPPDGPDPLFAHAFAPLAALGAVMLGAVFFAAIAVLLRWAGSE